MGSSTERTVTSYDFLYWQCQIRQQSFRMGDGRPTSGMCPTITVNNNNQLGKIITLITKKSPENLTTQFRYMVKKTLEPTERWEAAIRLFSEMYYQNPKDFSDEITTLFAPHSKTHEQLITAKNCRLQFEQNNQCFQIACTVTNLTSDHPQFQFTFWHNSLFNPYIPGDSKILAFTPDWSSVSSKKLS